MGGGVSASESANFLPFNTTFKFTTKGAAVSAAAAAAAAAFLNLFRMSTVSNRAALRALSALAPFLCKGRSFSLLFSPFLSLTRFGLFPALPSLSLVAFSLPAPRFDVVLVHLNVFLAFRLVDC